MENRLWYMNKKTQKSDGAFVLVLEHHPHDSRVLIKEDGICQSLTSRMGTGVGQRPDCTCYRKSRRSQSITDYETWVDAEVANTINAFDIGDIRSTNIVVCFYMCEE